MTEGEEEEEEVYGERNKGGTDEERVHLSHNSTDAAQHDFTLKQVQLNVPPPRRAAQRCFSVSGAAYKALININRR